MPERFQEKKEIIYKILTDAINAHNYKKICQSTTRAFRSKNEMQIVQYAILSNEMFGFRNITGIFIESGSRRDAIR